MTRLQAEGISDDELEKARTAYKGRLMLRLEDSRNVSGWLGSQETLLGYALTPDEIVTQLDAITLNDLAGIVKHYILPEKLHLAAVGPVPDEGQLNHLLGL
jgi:predicted Zn-dependent peptidase